MKEIIKHIQDRRVIHLDDLATEDLNTHIVILRQTNGNELNYGILARLSTTYFFAGLNYTTNGWNDVTGKTPTEVIRSFTDGENNRFYIFETKQEFAKWFNDELH